MVCGSGRKAGRFLLRVHMMRGIEECIRLMNIITMRTRFCCVREKTGSRSLRKTIRLEMSGLRIKGARKIVWNFWEKFWYNEIRKWRHFCTFSRLIKTKMPQDFHRKISLHSEGDFLSSVENLDLTNERNVLLLK